MAQADALGVLHIRFPDGSDHAVEVESSPFNIGRGGDNHLQLPDPKVSRNHARLLFEDDKVVLIDLNSSNGTFLGEERLAANQPYPLRIGEAVGIGPYELTLEKPASEPAWEPEEEPEPAKEARRSEGEAAEPPAADEPAAESEAESGSEPAPEPDAEPEPEAEPEPGVKIGTQPVPKAAEEEVIAATKAPPPEPPGGPPTPPEPAPPSPPDPVELDPAFGVPQERSRYLDFLPPIYDGDPFLGRFLLAFEGLLTPIEQTVDNFDLYLDPGTTPNDFLEELAYWLGLSLDEKWPEEKRRAVVAEAAELHRRRGTAWSLSRQVEIYTGVAPEITESKKKAHHFEVSLSLPKGAKVNREAIERIIQANKPAHTSYDLEIKKGGGGRTKKGSS